MPKTIDKIPQMSAKYLADFISATGWTRTTDDVYRGGQLLAEVLPRFGTDEGALPPPPVQPAAPEADSQGRMSVTALTAFNAEMSAYNKAFITWCRTPAPSFELTDKQHDLCRHVIKHFSEKAQFPVNEFSYKLLAAFSYASEEK